MRWWLGHAGRVWGAVPPVLRKGIVAVVGATLVVTGLALVVLPGPFTLPLLLAGFALLATEFAWAGVVMARTRRGMEQTGELARRTLRRR